MNDASTEQVVELAKQAIQMVRTISPGWEQVFIRFNANESGHGWKGSYVDQLGVHIFDVLSLRNEGQRILAIGSSLRDALARDGRSFVACLLRANSSFQYQIDFEWNDETKWGITKLDGRSGLPDGLDLLPPLA